MAHRLRRMAPLLVGAALLIAVTLVLTHVVPLGNDQARLFGSDLEGTPAPAFRLTNGQNQPVSLAALRGKAIALTFLYTDCPDLCPLTTAKFRQAYDQLGPDAAKVAFVAITVDPETDTPGRIAQYSSVMGMAGKWEFLTGTRAELAPIWKAYAVAPLPLSEADLLAQKGIAVARTDPAFTAAHSLVVYVIDPLGRERRLLDPDFTVPDLVADLRAFAASTS